MRYIQKEALVEFRRGSGCFKVERCHRLYAVVHEYGATHELTLELSPGCCGLNRHDIYIIVSCTSVRKGGVNSRRWLDKPSSSSRHTWESLHKCWQRAGDVVMVHCGLLETSADIYTKRQTLPCSICSTKMCSHHRSSASVHRLSALPPA